MQDDRYLIKFVQFPYKPPRNLWGDTNYKGRVNICFLTFIQLNSRTIMGIKDTFLVFLLHILLIFVLDTFSYEQMSPVNRPKFIYANNNNNNNNKNNNNNSSSKITRPITIEAYV